MNARFSSNLFEQPQNPAGREETKPHDGIFAGLVSSAGHEVVTARLALEMGAMTEPATEPVAKSATQAADIDDIFVPDHYEPNYAYPVLVWLQTTAWPPGALNRIMRMVSERNYFGVPLRVVDSDRIEEQLQQTFARLRRQYHLHTERVFLVGIGEAGTQALATGLGRPDWFGGIAAISSPWPTAPRLFARYDDVRGKRVLLGVDDRDDDAVVCGVERAQKLLWTAGMHVTTLSCTNGGKSCPGLFRQIDRWLMQGIEQPELVC
jgi:phospholipase/carboxylesterase